MSVHVSSQRTPHFSGIIIAHPLYIILYSTILTKLLLVLNNILCKLNPALTRKTESISLLTIANPGTDKKQTDGSY
jgi:hypothetical protein